MKNHPAAGEPLLMFLLANKPTPQPPAMSFAAKRKDDALKARFKKIKAAFEQLGNADISISQISEYSGVATSLVRGAIQAHYQMFTSREVRNPANNRRMTVYSIIV